MAARPGPSCRGWSMALSGEPARPSQPSGAVLWPSIGALANRFVAIVKQSFQMDASFSEIEARPLRGDPRTVGAQAFEAGPNDFLWRKRSTDVVVTGTVRTGRPVSQHRVTVSVGPLSKRVCVHGDRRARVRRGRVVFEGATGFDAMRLEHRRTYGGVDPRVGDAGIYPRNPFGCGYVAVDGDCEVHLPNFEDPAALLSPDNFLLREAEGWWSRPLPWSTLPMPPCMFPRCAYVGEGAGVSWPNDRREVTEVSRGLLPRPLSTDQRSFVAPGFFSEASLGLALRTLPSGTPVCLDGFSGRQAFVFPRPPHLVTAWERHRWSVSLRAMTLLCDIDAGIVDVVWCGVHELDRSIPNPRLSDAPARLFIQGREVVT